MTKNFRVDVPLRYRRARASATLRTLQGRIEDTFGLPEGSLKFIYPNGRKARYDTSVGVLRRRWE